jgi:23S rRNA U2552 (ribose-2'-O)-methylase RlmE/FtsJ
VVPNRGLFKELESQFKAVKIFKPDASRKNSSEFYFVAQKFKDLKK